MDPTESESLRQVLVWQGQLDNMKKYSDIVGTQTHLQCVSFGKTDVTRFLFYFKILIMQKIDVKCEYAL